MTPHEIIAGLRAAGVCPLLPRESGRILRTGGRRDLLESAHALNLMQAQNRVLDLPATRIDARHSKYIALQPMAGAPETTSPGGT